MKTPSEIFVKPWGNSIRSPVQAQSWLDARNVDSAKRVLGE